MAGDVLHKNMVILSETVTRDVIQDMITVSFCAAHTGSDPNEIKSLLNMRLAEALAQANACAKDGEVDVSTGRFSINPVYGKKNEITSYHGTATMIVSGTDAVAISLLAGQISTMNIDSTEFSISRQLRESLEGQMGDEAIMAFRNRALDYAQSFDFQRFDLITATVSVSTANRCGNRSFPMGIMVGSSPQPASPSIATGAGRETISATVSGTIQLR